jgi:hypothetical protein
MARAARWAELRALVEHEVLRADWGSLGPSDLGELKALVSATPRRGWRERAGQVAAWLSLLGLAAVAVGILTGQPEKVQNLLATWALAPVAALLALPSGARSLAEENRSVLASRLKPLDAPGVQRVQRLALSDSRADPYRLAVESAGRELLGVDLHRMEVAAKLSPDIILRRRS